MHIIASQRVRRDFVRAARRPRRGALMSMELVIVLPILIAMFFAMIEFSMLWSAKQRLKDASLAGCRVATFPGATEPAVRQAVEAALNKQPLVKTYTVQVDGGWRSGDDVAVTVQVPMRAAAPDLLGLFGLGMGRQSLVSQTIMRKE